MNTRVQSTPIGVRQPDPPEGRKAYPLTNPALTFITGNEIFEWDSASLGQQEPSAIMGAWIDTSASNPAAIPNLFLFVDVNPNSSNWQRIAIPMGTQGYIILIQQKPVKVLISQNAGIAFTARVILFNYNPLYTGDERKVSPSLTPTGSGGAGANKNINVPQHHPFVG